MFNCFHEATLICLARRSQHETSLSQLRYSQTHVILKLLRFYHIDSFCAAEVYMRIYSMIGH